MSTDSRQMTISEILVVASDPSARKHKNNPQSNEAHERVRRSKEATYKRIMELLRSRAEYGATSKEIAAAFGVGLNTISGRFSEMKQMNWIRESGARRAGAAVLVVKQCLFDG